MPFERGVWISSILVKLFIRLFLPLVMSVFWPELPCVLVCSLHVVDANIMQDFLQVNLKKKQSWRFFFRLIIQIIILNDWSHCGLFLYNYHQNLKPGCLPLAVWWYPPGPWCCSTGASQRQRTTCPAPAACLLSLFCPPPSFSSHTPAATESKHRSVTDSYNNHSHFLLSYLIHK